jgi:ectoine hydroxylase-related dioxygenase (phytanoyl-CoA dioxygenase family)
LLLMLVVVVHLRYIYHAQRSNTNHSRRRATNLVFD